MALRKRVRQPTLEEQVALYLDRDITLDEAFKILSQAEVRDAMNWVIGSGGDPRFRNIVRLMREDAIWRYWMQRDMGEVYGDGQLPLWVRYDAHSRVQSPIDQPQWKVAYLWYRLTYTVYQRRLVNKYIRYLRDSRIPHGRMRLKYLNVVENIDLHQDFNFLEMYPAIYRDMNIPLPDMYLFSDDVEYSTTREVQKIELDLEKMIPDSSITYSIHAIAVGYLMRVCSHIITHKKFGLGPLTSEDYPKTFFQNWEVREKCYDALKKFPRIYEPTKIIVAAPICAACYAPAPTLKCSCPCGAPYCGVECQARGGHYQ